MRSYQGRNGRQRAAGAAAAVLGALAVAAAAASAGAPASFSTAVGAGWAQPGQGVAGTRAVVATAISARTVARLAPVWRFTFPGDPGFSGSYASTPVVAGGVVFLQDLFSDVYALDLRTGATRWARRFHEVNGGPNGVAAVGGRVYGNTSTRAFALDARTGRVLWTRRLIRPGEPFIEVAPVVAGGIVFTSTLGFPPNGKGTLYGLDAATGAVRWRYVTVVDPWAVPKAAGGGGAWWPGAVDSSGRLFFGNSNPYPYGGTASYPNGAVYAGPARWTSSLLALEARSGRLLWAYQVVPHDVRDYDVGAPVVVDLRIAGRAVPAVLAPSKNGRVYAWDRRSGRLLWSTAVGRHENDTGPLPRARVSVCPGLLGGVETPTAYSAGRLFVPVVDLCLQGGATGFENLYRVDYSQGRGALVALDATTGRRLWQRRFASPNFGCAAVARDVVFTATYDGWVYGLSVRTGATLWRVRAPAGVNACPAIAGDTLLLGAGAVDAKGIADPVPQLVAYRLPSGRAG